MQTPRPTYYNVFMELDAKGVPISRKQSRTTHRTYHSAMNELRRVAVEHGVTKHTLFTVKAPPKDQTFVEWNNSTGHGTAGFGGVRLKDRNKVFMHVISHSWWFDPRHDQRPNGESWHGYETYEQVQVAFDGIATNKGLKPITWRRFNGAGPWLECVDGDGTHHHWQYHGEMAK